MIRDPSDGSVREGITCYERDEILCEDQMCMRTGCRLRNERLAPKPTSGLPAGSTKPEQIARLNESRKWLAEYHAKKAEGAGE